MLVTKLPEGKIIPLKEDFLFKKILGSQLKSKMKYTQIKPVIQINFDNYEVNENNKRIIKKCFIKDETNTIITDVLEIDHINIEKCSMAWYNKTIKNYEKKEQDLIRIGALFMIDNVKDFKTCLKEVHMSKEIKNDIEEAVEEYSQDEELLDLYDKEKIIEADRILISQQAREEGLKEGKEEGLKQGLQEGIEKGIEKGINKRNIEIVKNSLKQGLDIDTISKITGLSIEEIKNLK